MRELTFEDARAASMGGLVFGAGGGGLERGLEAARAVFQVGTPGARRARRARGRRPGHDHDGRGRTGHAAAADLAARRAARAGARVRGLGRARRDRRHDDGPPGRVHGRHLARERARSAPGGRRLQRQRPRSPDGRDGRHGAREPHRHLRRPGGGGRRRGSPRPRRDRRPRADRHRLQRPPPRLGRGGRLAARLARALPGRVPARVRRRRRRLGLHPPRRGHDRRRGRRAARR